MKKQTVVMCASVSHYQMCVDLVPHIERLGFVADMPTGAIRMMKEFGFSALDEKNDYLSKPLPERSKVKNGLMNDHFDKIKKGDICLIVNGEKNGFKGYIGGNVLMEMACAYLFGKPVYVLHDVDPAIQIYDEIVGILPTLLHGDITQLVK